MSLKILGVITPDKVYRIKVDKYIDELSNKLSDENISHLIIDDSVNGIGIMLEQDVPNFLIHNDDKNQWEYLERYMIDDEDDAMINQTFVVEDSNKNIDILGFLKMVLKNRKED